MPYVEPGWQEAHVWADALAIELQRRGLITRVYHDGGHKPNPCVMVRSERCRSVPRIDFIYLATGKYGDWWFWWSSLHPIGPVTELPTAAGIVVRRFAIAQIRQSIKSSRRETGGDSLI